MVTTSHRAAFSWSLSTCTTLTRKRKVGGSAFSFAPSNNANPLSLLVHSHSPHRHLSLLQNHHLPVAFIPHEPACLIHTPDGVLLHSSLPKENQSSSCLGFSACRRRMSILWLWKTHSVVVPAQKLLPQALRGLPDQFSLSTQLLSIVANLRLHSTIPFLRPPLQPQQHPFLHFLRCRSAGTPG